MIPRPQLDDLYPLTPVQSSILFHTLQRPESGVYTLQTSCRLTGPFDPNTFEHALSTIVDRHPALRTSFVWEATPEPLQVVHATAGPVVNVLDWRDRDRSDFPALWNDLRRTDRHQPFALDRPPLLRATVVSESDTDWRLVLTMHHLIVDGWSHAIVVAEIASAYEALAAGRTPELGATVPFRDFIAWRQERNGHDALQRWSQALDGFTVPTPLPGLGCGVGRAAFDEHEVRIPDGISERLHGTARTHRITLNTIIQGAWAMVLATSSGHRDVVFGTTVAGRPPELVGIETSVGVFVDTLPVRVDVDFESRWIEWLQALQAREFERRSWSDVWMADIARHTSLAPGTPLFETVVAFQNYPFDPTLLHSWAGLRITDVEPAESSHFPLTLEVSPFDTLSVRLKYDARRVGAEAVKRAARLFERCLERIASDPDSEIGALEPLESAEKARILGDWNATDAPTTDGCVQDLVAAQAASTPEAPAVICGAQSLSYGALETQANQLAHHLRGLGVGPDARVALVMTPSVDVLVAILGTLKAGGAYLPLDPRLDPDSRIEFILSDAQPAVVLTNRAQLERLPETNAAVVCIDDDHESARISSNPALSPEPVTTPEHLAYVIYTSGSTGTPKGVMVEHGSVTNYLQWFVGHLPAEGIGAPLITSLAFDMAVTSTFAPLLVGKAVVVPTPDQELHDLVLEGGADFTFVKLTPSQLRSLAHTAPTERAWTRLLVLGGESVDAATVSPWFERWPDLTVVNEYGPTETTVGCTSFTMTARDELSGGIPIGRPGPNTKAYVLDERGRLLPPGVPGELYVGGLGLARGYLNREALTTERFVERGAVPGERLYRTGDLAGWRDDGLLEFLGRMDDQVKVRGFRVELGEVEAALASHAHVRDCAVIARTEDANDTRLVAYIVPETPSGPSVELMRAHLLRHVPRYMVPATFVTIDTLPLTPNGKLDRARLPAPVGTRPDLEVAVVAPRNEAEAVLARIWSELLGIERVGIHDDFFALGGDSLMATRLLARVCDWSGIPVPLRALFDAPTIEEQARAIEAAIAMLLDEIETLSDEEIHARLERPSEVRAS